MVLITDLGHLMFQLEGRRGVRKGSSLSSTHIPAIRLQHIFTPLKRGKGVYLLYDCLEKKTITAGKFSYDISGRD